MLKTLLQKTRKLHWQISTTISQERQQRSSKYEIISHYENYDNTGEIFVRFQLKGTRETLIKSVKEIYKSNWLHGFSQEDVAFISILFTSEQSKMPQLISLFPRKKHRITRPVVILAMLFVTFLTLSNLTAFKLAEIDLHSFAFLHLQHSYKIDLPVALMFFPLTYFFDDTLTEVYGFKLSRLVIWGGLACSAVLTLLATLTVAIPPAPIWHHQKAFALVFNSTPIIFLASALGYFVGEFCNSIILSKMKILTSGRWFALRIITSTSIGVGLDSMIFCFMAFSHILPTYLIWRMIITQYIFKVSYEILALPITYLLTGYLKRIDKVDYYDYKTVFNPFSLSLEDESTEPKNYNPQTSTS